MQKYFEVSKYKKGLEKVSVDGPSEHSFIILKKITLWFSGTNF